MYVPVFEPSDGSLLNNVDLCSAPITLAKTNELESTINLREP